MISWGKQPRTMETTPQLGTTPAASLRAACWPQHQTRTRLASRLLTALCNYTSTNPAWNPVSGIPGETQVLLLQSGMPVSAGSCGQPPRVETQACSTYSEVSHQLQHYLLPSACEGFKKKIIKFRSAWGLMMCWEDHKGAYLIHYLNSGSNRWGAWQH